jgi:hypothetical protein
MHLDTWKQSIYYLNDILEINMECGLCPQHGLSHSRLEISYAMKAISKVLILHQFTFIVITTYLLLVMKIMNEVIFARLIASYSVNFVKFLSKGI